MEETTKSPTRTKATWKPRIDEGDPSFFEVQEVTMVALGGAEPGSFREPGRAPVAEMPYQGRDGLAEALGRAPMALLEADEVPEGVQVSYRIVGGYDTNAVEVRWALPADGRGADGQPLQLSWVMLKTFTGLQVKYPLPGKRCPLVFALADEDAYVYCNEPVCKECTFRCKQGFVIYAAIAGLGIVKVPLSPNARRGSAALA